uniref:Large ribosomal subunit protein uL18c n=1 Tax=Acrosorium ciliolatum TaxID=1550622 RepID=A0A1Z1M2H5_9FLOR|nr:ribosomal protein L18 [Acrosorium ciliolatum]ARW60051.1 ribosomal protein L18 [Acrosorium ciliolatum]
MKKKIIGTLKRPRLYVFKSNKHIYAQLIDDHNNKILTSSSSISKDIKNNINNYANCETAKIIGKNIAIKLKEKGINQIIFDRGNKIYHGKIKALAEATRNEGINF